MDDKTDPLPPLSPGATRSQYGALCWRIERGLYQVLLVSSRDTGRWVIPKGWPIAGLSPEASAAREAWEEAGVEGEADPACIGLFAYDKAFAPAAPVPCVVAVYPLRVTRLRDRFPERKERLRKWFTPERAAKKVIEPELRAILAGFVPVLPEAAAPKDAAPPDG